MARRGTAPFGLTMLSAAYGVALLVWVAAVPSSPGHQTLLEYGGPESLLITSQALVFTLVMWALLRRRCTTGSRGATIAARTIGVVFVVWSILGALSLAAGAFPAAVLLLAAVALTPRPDPLTA
ncbi:MAG: hypothetical protein ACJ75I_04640 [Solirubrobacterales bacterium]